MKSTEISRVVVIDDDEGTVEIIAAFLAEIPYVRSHLFTCPRLLLTALQTMPKGDFPSLVFSDISMPEYNGLQLVDQLELICRQRRIAMPKVIFISGNIEERNRSDNILRLIHERGFQTVSKPFRMETILEVAQQAIA